MANIAWKGASYLNERSHTRKKRERILKEVVHTCCQAEGSIQESRKGLMRRGP